MIYRAALAFAIGFVLYFIVLVAAPMFGHDHNRPELKPWFQQLKSSAGSYCCDGSDAISLDEVDFDTKDDHYRVRLNGQWVDVPDGAVIKEPNKAGPAMVWPMYGPNGSVGVRCFIPGVLT